MSTQSETSTKRRQGKAKKIKCLLPDHCSGSSHVHNMNITLQLLVKWWHICITRLIIKSACYSGYDECKRRGHDEVLGSEPHCPQSGFQESLIPSCEVFKHGFHRGGVDFFWNKPLLQKNILYFQIFRVINLFRDAKCIFVVWGSFVVSSYMLLNRIP